MILLVCFDLPRYTKEERRDAAKFRKHLVGLGFIMKQYSVYERPIQRTETRDKILSDMSKRIPRNGKIVLYELPDYVNEKQITLLGAGTVLAVNKKPQLIVL